MRNVIIIGGGPAGYTAAIYTGRAGLSPLVIEGPIPGGQLIWTSEVENFPGYEAGVQGPQLMMKMRQQAEKFGAEIVSDSVTAVDFSSKPFTVEFSGAKEQAKAVIIATGASSRMLDIPAEKKLFGRGVSVCATCDAAFYRNKKAVVVGGGDAALEDAMVLTRFASEVHLIHRRDGFRASKIMQDKVFSNPKIKVIWDSVVEDITDPAINKVTGVKVKNLKTGAVTQIASDGVFVAIGHRPSSDLFKGKVELDEGGYIMKKKWSQTSVEGVFVCGDVSDSRYRQAITAAGSGCQAALDAEKFLSEG